MSLCRAFVVLLGFAVSSCSLAPKMSLPAPSVPASWPAGDAYLAQTEAGLPVVSYNEIFGDARLQRLVEQALINNRDLRIAAANLTAARAQVRVVRANQFPQIGVNASTSESVIGSGPATTDYSATIALSSFEIDLFGKLANATAAQRDRALSTEAVARTVRLGLIADLAEAWVSYAADRDLLEIARATAENAQKSVTLTRARLAGGIAPRTDVRQAEQVLATAHGDVARQTTALAQDENSIRLLIGADFDRTLLPGSLREVVASIRTLPAGTSSQVLLRRPDVIEAEYQLWAANADLGVARAELFPSITLTGLGGFASNTLANLFTGGAIHASGTAGASYAIFASGGARAKVDVTKAQRDAALAGYEKAIETAFREVADALADQGTLAERILAATANREAAEDTAMLVEARYRGGIDSFLADLDAQRSLYSARQAEVETNLEAILNRVTLYRVLGGEQPASSAPPSSQP